MPRVKKTAQKGNAEGGKEPKERKPRKLTTKQRKIVKAVGEGKTQRQAATIAGVTETYVSEVLKKPEVVATIQSLMDKAGLSDSVLLSKHVELLNAQKTISAISGGKADEKTVDFVDVPDHAVQVKALEMGYKLKGAFVEKKEVTFPEGLDITVKYVKPGQDGNRTP